MYNHHAACFHGFLGVVMCDFNKTAFVDSLKKALDIQNDSYYNPSLVGCKNRTTDLIVSYTKPYKALSAPLSIQAHIKVNPSFISNLTDAKPNKEDPLQRLKNRLRTLSQEQKIIHCGYYHLKKIINDDECMNIASTKLAPEIKLELERVIDLALDNFDSSNDNIDIPLSDLKITDESVTDNLEISKFNCIIHTDHNLKIGDTKKETSKKIYDICVKTLMHNFNTSVLTIGDNKTPLTNTAELKPALKQKLKTIINANTIEDFYSRGLIRMQVHTTLDSEECCNIDFNLADFNLSLSYDKSIKNKQKIADTCLAYVEQLLRQEYNFDTLKDISIIKH